MRIPGAGKTSRVRQIVDYWAAVASPSKLKYEMGFYHPHAGTDDFFSSNQRISYNFHGDILAGTLKEIRFGAITQFMIDLDKGDSGKLVTKSEIKMRPNVVSEPFREEVVYEYGLTENAQFEFRKKMLEITNKEFNALREQNDEKWEQLPDSIYGVMTLFMIRSHEVYSEISEQIKELKEEFLVTGDIQLKVKRDALEVELYKNLASFQFNFIILLGFLVLCFLIQFVLIYFIGADYLGYTDEEDLENFCIQNDLVQMAVAILILFQFVNSLSDVYVEARCYVSKAMSIYEPENSAYKTVRIDSSRRSYLSFVVMGMTIACELCICVLVFVFGQYFILAQGNVGEIVQGSVGIIFITDIDNMIYSIMPEFSLANIEETYFRLEDFDIFNNIWESLPYALKKNQMIKKGKSEDDKRTIKEAEAMRNIIRTILTYIASAMLVIIIVAGCIYVAFSKVDRCEEYSKR